MVEEKKLWQNELREKNEFKTLWANSNAQFRIVVELV